MKADTTYVDAQVATRGRLVQGTAVNSTSGTSIDFTGIPSWAKRITISFAEVSTNGSSNKIIQVGSSSIQTTGYASTSQYGNVSATGNGSSSAGFIVFSDNASFFISGTLTLTLVGANQWASSHTVKVSTAQTAFGGGSVTLSGILDRIRVTTVNGTDTFDAGSINIIYEG